ncbi:MAG TPA: hypothetical protein DCM86_02855 [Verrucomicrobiales bacterium]|nr:hypothetical protein [Verrucomicrobiales bacterium]
MAKKSRTRKRLSRQQVRDLEIEIGFLEGVIARDPSYVDALKLLSDDYLLQGSFELGLGIDERLVQLLADDPEAYFNLACSYSLTGQTRAALDALSLAIDYGYTDWKWIARETSLENLRQAPCYQQLLAKIQAILTPSY